ncbi:uncharacterized protein LOC142344970 [Convolutriloba macropyga]|uniref:uncharacterized protein LOC142344970 n=1 Tax=Convolutriloba macropyga TaxID=536237 RepID=UPI003F521722
MSRLFFLLFWLIDLVVASEFEFDYDGIDENHQSQVFILPTRWSEASRHCASHSKHACLNRFEVSVQQSERSSLVGDTRRFGHLIRPRYMRYNFFTLMSRTNRINLCCAYQKEIYRIFGRGFGLDPLEYFTRLTNFSMQGKHLNWIHAEYRAEHCCNVILSVGYGQGTLVIGGNVNFEHPFGFPFHLGRELAMIPDNRFEEYLRYDWFISYVFCKDQFWICELNNIQENNFRRRLRSTSAFSHSNQNDFCNVNKTINFNRQRRNHKRSLQQINLNAQDEINDQQRYRTGGAVRPRSMSSDSEAPGSASVAIEPSSSAESSTIWGLSSQYYYLSVRAFFVTPLIFYCCTGSLSLGDMKDQTTTREFLLTIAGWVQEAARNLACLCIHCFAKKMIIVVFRLKKKPRLLQVLG